MPSLLVFNRVEFIDWRYSQSVMLVFSTGFVNIAPLTFSMVSMAKKPKTRIPDSDWADIQKEIPFMTWTIKTGSLLNAQVHGYLLGLKSIKTLIVGLLNLNLLTIISTILIINLH